MKDSQAERTWRPEGDNMRKIRLDLAESTETGPVTRRTAVRGIVRRDGHYLIIHSRYGDYKFPGGGRQDGEQLMDTLIREVKEETGYDVLADTAQEYLEVYERCARNGRGLMEMISYYYFCEVSGQAGERNLDDYEAAYGYEVQWLTLEEIIKKNEAVTDISMVPWVVRETKVMRMLAEDPHNQECGA